MFGGQQSRRHFLSAAICSLATCIPAVHTLGNEPDGLEAWLQHLARQLPDGAALGERYLEVRPDEASAAWLARALFGEDLMRAKNVDRSRFVDRVAAGCASDYRNGKLVVLRGWTLTRTEGRVLALLSLRAA